MATGCVVAALAACFLAQLEATRVSDQAELGRESELDGASPKALAHAYSVRQCILQKATDFPRLRERFGSNLTAKEVGDLEKHVIAKWHFEDLMNNHLSKYNIFKRFISSYRSSSISKWKEEIDEVDKHIWTIGFHYDAMKKRCASGASYDVGVCMLKTAPESLRDNLQARMDAEDMMVHRIHGHSELYVASKEVRQHAKLLLEASGFSFKKAFGVCKNKVEIDNEALYELISAGIKKGKDVGSQCVEDDTDDDHGFCPEGTTPIRSREIDPVAGMKWFSIGYFGSWGAGSIIGGVMTALVAAPAGPLAMLAAFPVGFTVGASFTPTSAMGAAFSAWNAIGPSACACFPRECVFNEVEKRCVIGGGKASSSNPFGRALPYMSMKCVPRPKAESECDLQQCTQSDYLNPEGNLSGAHFFGKIGQADGGVYNCLSTTGRSVDALAFQMKLPSGLPNTAKSRAALFESLGVKPSFGNEDQQAGEAPHGANSKASAREQSMRQCILQKATDFPRLRERFGSSLTAKEVDDLEKHIIAKWRFEDLLKNHRSKYNMFTKRNSNISKWKDDLDEVEKSISTIGFLYDAVKKRCASGISNDVSLCMLDMAPERLRDNVQARMDAEDMMVHRIHGHSDAYVASKEEGQHAKLLLKASGFSFKKAFGVCKNKVEVDKGAP